jgi:hypothetical protein
VNNDTGRFSVKRFLNEYRLHRRRNPNSLPVIRLQTGSYKSRFGSLVHKPILAIVGRIEMGTNKLPDTSIPGMLNDDLPDIMK